MSLDTRLRDLIVAMGTDYKLFRTWITGSSTGTLSSLDTTTKSSLVGAINELAARESGTTAPDSSESNRGVVELASLAEVATGVDTERAVTAAGVRQERLALKAEILGGAGPAFDTLNELKALVDGADESADITSLTTVVGTKANSSDVYSKTDIGDVDVDLVGAYTTAKA